MMSIKRATIKYTDGTSVIDADKLDIQSERLLVYNADALVGVFRDADVQCAYLSVPKGGGADA